MKRDAFCFATARRIVSLMDLTSLNETDDEAAIVRLAGLAVSKAGTVAAVCTWAQFIPAARKALLGTGVRIAAVANFPAGAAAAEQAAGETAAAVAAGADEVDVVFPYRALLAGDAAVGLALVQRCRSACGDRALLKVILETGELGAPDTLRRAAEIAVSGGAHFLKTSTGKTLTGATPEAVAALLQVIAQSRDRGRAVGLKVSGGIRNFAAARDFLDQYEQRFGFGSATPANFRIGASTLIGNLLEAMPPEPA
ncbi:MAG: deoxyribose-phosphate aldolase [Steroidobacteraceae bacterium]